VRSHRVRVARREQNCGNPLCDEILDLRRLLCRVHLTGDDHELEAVLLRAVAKAFLELLEERMRLREERHTDDRFAAARGCAVASAGSETQDEKSHNREVMTHPVGS